MRRAVVTGLGAVTCLGNDIPTFWRNLIDGTCGIRPIEKFDTAGYRNDLAGTVIDFDLCSRCPDADPAMDEATRFALAASREALDDAGIADPRAAGSEPLRSGVIMSTNFGGATSWESFVAPPEDAPEPALLFREAAFNTTLTHLAQACGFSGPSALLSISCASSTAAIGEALDLIRYGRADLMLAGGHDSISPSSLSGLCILRTVSPTMIRPFDKGRDGTLFGEGAAVVVIEELEHAQARSAPIYAEVLGYWQNNNAYHMTAPDKEGEGMVRVLARALEDAGVPPGEVDYINAHGTGTPPHDATEVRAIKAVLGDHAYEIPVSSIKGAVTHIMGGAGSIEAIATLLAMRDGLVPPTINYREPDPECDLDHVPNEAKQQGVACAVSISAGIGGSNAAVVFRRL
ncbi:MAG: beta-ketoacyl-[acyl-carrier-protein] synthase family protein [Armatimonadota bacterium]|jgi:3-oxoacyl-(acyl-carrier-protein) synthase